MGRHVVVEDLQRPRGLLPPPQPFKRRRLRHQRLPPQREATIVDGRIQMGQRLLPFPGPRQPPPQVEPQPVPLAIVRELIQHPPQQRNPIPPPHPRQAPPQQMQRIRRQLTLRQLRRGKPFLRFGPASPPEGIGPKPVGRRGPGRGPRERRHQRWLRAPSADPSATRWWPRAAPPPAHPAVPPAIPTESPKTPQAFPRPPRAGPPAGRARPRRRSADSAPGLECSGLRGGVPAGTAGLQTGTARRRRAESRMAARPDRANARTTNLPIGGMSLPAGNAGLPDRHARRSAPRTS